MGVITSLTKSATLSPVASNRGGWVPWIREPFGGAWQRNIEWKLDSVLAHPTVYACVTLIAADMAKMDAMLVEETHPRLWVPTFNPAFSPVLREPNDYQTDAQFRFAWSISKLVHGNTYVLQQRDNRGVVVRQHVLDPSRVTVLVAPTGAVFYQLQADNLSGMEEAVTVPSTEIIHDRAPVLFHPLVGVPPMFASGAPAEIGLRVQRNSSAFFGNGSNPSGVLKVPTQISQEQADKLSEQWNQMAAADNSGTVPVLPNGMEFVPLRMTAVESQLIEQMNWSDEAICRAFRVPPDMVGVGVGGQASKRQNVEADTRKYLTTCLHDHVIQFEKCMDKGLGLNESKGGGKRLGIQLDQMALMQMDTATQYKTLSDGVRGGFLAPNEARRIVDLEPLVGGDTVYLQHQDYPIEMLFNRKPPDEGTGAPEPPEPDDEGADDEMERFIALRARTLRLKAAN